MELTIVWRNPETLLRTKQTVQRVQGDPSCVVYVVDDRDGSREFRLILSAPVAAA